MWVLTRTHARTQHAWSHWHHTPSMKLAHILYIIVDTIFPRALTMLTVQVTIHLCCQSSLPKKLFHYMKTAKRACLSVPNISNAWAYDKAYIRTRLSQNHVSLEQTVHGTKLIERNHLSQTEKRHQVVEDTIGQRNNYQCHWLRYTTIMGSDLAPASVPFSVCGGGEWG